MRHYCVEPSEAAQAQRRRCRTTRTVGTRGGVATSENWVCCRAVSVWRTGRKWRCVETSVSIQWWPWARRAEVSAPSPPTTPDCLPSDSGQHGLLWLWLVNIVTSDGCLSALVRKPLGYRPWPAAGPRLWCPKSTWRGTSTTSCWWTRRNLKVSEQ